VYGIGQGSLHLPALQHGAILGTLVHSASYAALLPAAKLSPPFWKQPPREVLFGLTSHLVYGLSVAAAYVPLEKALGRLGR
jgi:uncharacterized membrane protein YagU involved in acid resistance